MPDQRIQDILSYFIESDEGWDEIDGFNFQHYKTVLACDIGQFKKGQKVDVLSVMLIDVKVPTVQIFDLGKCWEFPINNFSFEFGEGKELVYPSGEELISQEIAS